MKGRVNLAIPGGVSDQRRDRCGCAAHTALRTNQLSAMSAARKNNYASRSDVDAFEELSAKLTADLRNHVRFMVTGPLPFGPSICGAFIFHRSNLCAFAGRLPRPLGRLDQNGRANWTHR
jgi:hypothetical protein